MLVLPKISILTPDEMDMDAKQDAVSLQINHVKSKCDALDGVKSLLDKGLL